MSLNNKSVSFIGAGNMAEALIRGLLTAGTVAPEQVVATDIRADRLDQLKQQYGIGIETDNAVAASRADIMILAVKPQQMSEVLASLNPPIGKSKLVVSIAAGVTTGRIEQELGGDVRVVRVMPNTPALVGEGAAAVAAGAHAGEDDLAAAETILAAVGRVVRVEERLMDAVTALSGSGPAYVFYVAEAMIAAGREMGLEEGVATQLAIQTIKGAGRLLAESDDTAAELRRKVTSPGGTTEAALTVLEAKEFKKIFAEAIAAATRRGQELSGS